MSFNYKPQEITIETSTGNITLRGINSDDLTGLVQRHGALLETWFEGEVDPMETLNKAPALVADMIACAAGDPQSVDVAVKMPIGLQIRAITAVFKLTFEEVNMGNVGRLFMLRAGTEQPTTGNRDT